MVEFLGTALYIFHGDLDSTDNCPLLSWARYEGHVTDVALSDLTAIRVPRIGHSQWQNYIHPVMGLPHFFH